jgi:hypothetical protein
MLETIMYYVMAATPYVLIALGIFGIFLLLARVTVKFTAPAARG